MDFMFLGTFGVSSLTVVGFRVTTLVFHAGHYAYIAFNEAPTMGAIGSIGTITVNGTDYTDWQVDYIDGKIVYVADTPTLVAGDTVTFSYDPALDGGITNVRGIQLREYTNEPFTEITGLFRSGVEEGTGLLWDLLVGVPTTNAVHADDILAMDYEGIYRLFLANEPVWRGGRYAENFCKYSKDLTNALWVATGAGTTKDDANTATLGTAATAGVSQNCSPVDGSPVLSRVVTVSLDVWVDSGTETFRVNNTQSAVVANYSPDLTATTVRQRFSFTVTNTSAAGNGLQNIGAVNSAASPTAKTIHVENMQAEFGSLPSEKIETTSTQVVAVFATEKGNTVASNVVTEAIGGDILPHPWLQSNAAGTNSQTYSNDLTNAVWTATTTTAAKDEAGIDAVAGEACTLTATGANSTVIAGSITAASANHVSKWFVKRKTGTGVIELTTDGGATWQAITLTADFDVFTVDQAAVTNPSIGIRIVTSGDAVIVGNAEAHLATTIVAVEALPPIITTTAAVTISATSYNHNLANISTSNASIALELVAEGESFDILKIGSQVLLKWDSTNGITLDDGTTITQYALAAGDHTVGVALGDDVNKIQLTINGTIQTERAYDPLTAGQIDVDATYYDLRSDVELTYADAQAKLLEWFA